MKLAMNWRQGLGYLFWTSIKLGLAVLVLLCFYVIYLDGVLSERFASNRYQAPAIIYGRALMLHPAANISPAALQQELTQLRYRPVERVTDTGQFSLERNGQTAILHIYRRPFDFADGPAMARQVKVRFNDNAITQVISWPDGRQLPEFKLEPPLVGRLTPSNNEDRLLVGLELIPNLLVETLLLVEDQDFYHHQGISITSIGRAALANLAAGRTVQGGSTLTQQLVKNLYLTREQNLWRKAREALMALVIDYRFSKNEILETYLNEVYFGQDRGSAIHGIGLASMFYYGKQVQELDAAEVALLVGIIKGPSYYDPRRYPERAQQRRDMILQLMFSQNMISKPDYLAALESPLPTYEQSGLVTRVRPHYMDLVAAEMAQIPLPKQWQQDGLRVFTYLDPHRQVAAEQALQRIVPQLPQAEALEAAIVVADHQQAGISAIVGGRNSELAGFNRALYAQRQVGSLLKPVIYGLALAKPQQYSLATPLSDAPLTLTEANGKTWTPQNYSGEYGEPMALYDAFVSSRNLPAVHLGLALGLEAIAQALEHNGVTTPIPMYPSLTLGAVSMSPLGITRLYSSFAQQGNYRPLRAIQAITTHDGLRIYDRPLARGERWLPAEAGYLVQHGLQGVINEGTGRALAAAVGEHQLAGKSGTTNDFRDSWFVTFDQQHVATVWLGRDDNQPMGLTGSSGALPVLRDYYQQVGVQPLRTQAPATISMQAYQSDTGERVPLTCDNARRFPAVAQPLPENINCEGELEEKSWWQRVFGN